MLDMLTQFHVKMETFHKKIVEIYHSFKASNDLFYQCENDLI